MSHMNAKILLGLSVATVITLISAGIISYNRNPKHDLEQTSDYALTGLREHENDVKSIFLTGAEEKTLVTLVNNDKGWSVKEKNGYPANTQKVRELILKLADARLLEPKTANEKRYPELGVENIKVKEAKGVLISLEGLKTPSKAIIGQLSNRGTGTFVRRPDDKQSWLAQGNLAIEKNPSNWLDNNLTNIASDRIAALVLTTPEGKTLRLIKEQPSDKAFKVSDLPKGREITSESDLNNLASTLANLTLSDVTPLLATALPEENKITKAVYRTFDGLEFAIQAWQAEDKHYARFAVSLDQAQAEAYIKSSQDKAKSDYEAKKLADEKNKGSSKDKQPEKNPVTESALLAVSDPDKDRQQRLDSLTKEATNLQERLSNWNFVIPSDKYANMDKSLEDILKPVAEKKKGGT